MPTSYRLLSEPRQFGPLGDLVPGCTKCFEFRCSLSVISVNFLESTAKFANFTKLKKCCVTCRYEFFNSVYTNVTAE